MSRQLPPLNALRIFEVAARTGSYSSAARELHLTHGAISRQIENLEDWLGQPLFVKQGQRMVPTHHALAYAQEVSAAFDHISDASLRYGKVASNKVIRVTAPATFAMRWLIPKVPDFRKIAPNVEIRVSTSLSTEPGLKGSFDVAIRRDLPVREQYEVTPLFRESTTVIVSPTLLGDKALRSVEELESQVLLTTETRPGDWEKWLVEAGHGMLRPSQFLRFDHFFVTLQAVVDGQGFGIGPFPTLQLDKSLERISTPFPDVVVSGSQYFALVPMDIDKPAHLRKFIDWLVEQSDKR